MKKPIYSSLDQLFNFIPNDTSNKKFVLQRVKRLLLKACRQVADKSAEHGQTCVKPWDSFRVQGLEIDSQDLENIIKKVLK